MGPGPPLRATVGALQVPPHQSPFVTALARKPRRQIAHGDSSSLAHAAPAEREARFSQTTAHRGRRAPDHPGDVLAAQTVQLVEHEHQTLLFAHAREAELHLLLRVEGRQRPMRPRAGRRRHHPQHARERAAERALAPQPRRLARADLVDPGLQLGPLLELRQIAGDLEEDVLADVVDVLGADAHLAHERHDRRVQRPMQLAPGGAVACDTAAEQRIGRGQRLHQRSLGSLRARRRLQCLPPGSRHGENV